jgi:hypothetical protein
LYICEGLEVNGCIWHVHIYNIKNLFSIVSHIIHAWLFMCRDVFPTCLFHKPHVPLIRKYSSIFEHLRAYLSYFQRILREYVQHCSTLKKQKDMFVYLSNSFRTSNPLQTSNDNLVYMAKSMSFGMYSLKKPKKNEETYNKITINILLLTTIVYVFWKQKQKKGKLKNHNNYRFIK